MWSEAVRVVRETQPRAFIFENVKGLTRSSFSTYFSYIQLQLQHPGIQRRAEEAWLEHLSRLEQHHTSSEEIEPEYRLVSRVLNAADYGVPQRRERVVFVGFRSDLGIKWNFPEKTHSFEALLWAQCRALEYWNEHRVPFAHRTNDVRAEIKAASCRSGQLQNAGELFGTPFANLPDPILPFERKVLNYRYQPGARAYPGHTGSPLDEPAKTLKAGVHGVPGGENMLLRPDGSVRYFTVRESARLQDLPGSI